MWAIANLSCRKKIMPLLENDMSKSTTVWQEIDDSFVSTKVSGPYSDAKL